MKNKGESSGQPGPKKGEFGPKIRSRLFFFLKTQVICVDTYVPAVSRHGARTLSSWRKSRGQGTAIGPAAYTVVEHFKERDGFHGNSG